MRIGIDLDNTIIFYDDAFVAGARERKLISSDFKGTKQQVRNHIRTLENGETQWQTLQGYVYGKGISNASLFPGVMEFIQKASGAGHELFIVSHKTEFGHFDPDKVNLREAALAFLETQAIFGHIPRENISFHATREAKIQKIANLSLDCFIDDLIEVFEEKQFPHATKRILFHTSPSSAPPGDWHTCQNWGEIEHKVLT